MAMVMFRTVWWTVLLIAPLVLMYKLYATDVTQLAAAPALYGMIDRTACPSYAPVACAPCPAVTPDTQYKQSASVVSPDRPSTDITDTIDPLSINHVVLLSVTRTNQTYTFVQSILPYISDASHMWAIHIVTDEPDSSMLMHLAISTARANNNRINIFTVPLNQSFVDGGLRFAGTTQKLSLGTLLPDVNRALVLDTDTFVFGAMQQIFDWFDQSVNERHVVAGATNNDNWYARHKNVSVPIARGMNAGVTFWQLDRVRQLGLQEIWYDMFFSANYELLEQDVLNMYLSKHKDQLLHMPCKFNWQQMGRPCDERPIVIVHCNGQTTTPICQAGRLVVAQLHADKVA